MATDARQLAYEVLDRVAGGGYADRSLDAALQRSPQIDPRDRGLATELVYGTLRLQNRLDFALAQLTKQPLAQLERRVLLLLRLGAYQILELDRVPGPVAVHETVALTKRSGLQRAAGLVNAVLRRLTREADTLNWPAYNADPVGHLTWALSLPAWLAERWHHDHGTEAVRMATKLLEPAPLTLRVNTLKLTRAAYLEQLEAAGHTAAPTRYAPEGLLLSDRGDAPLPGNVEGWYQVQDEASMLIAHLVAPVPGETLLDGCAAPGGKTTHLASLADNRAQIIAVDLHPHRVRLIEQGARRLGCQQITARTWDLTTPPDFLQPASFDAVLIDAPCSGLGVLRRNPEARWRLKATDIGDLQQRQLAILDQAARLVRPGGRLVYSVCTMTVEETDAVIATFLRSRHEFSRQSLAGLVPPAWQDLLDAQGALRTLSHEHDMDGFFAVRLAKAP